MGDYIGMESCLDIEDEEEVHASKAAESGAYSKYRGKRDQRLAMIKKKEFPPPIPLLARTENLPCRMPWVLKRHYTSDGRLILTEERVRHHEYFRAHRANGRLTLQLVPLDDSVWPPSSSADEDESDKEENEEADDYMESDDVDGGDQVESEIIVRKDRISVVEDSAPPANGSAGIGGNGAGKCLKYNNVASGSSCLFGVPVPAIRTIH
jgi:hypothetical protein